MIQFAHFNFNVLDVEKSIAFYKEAIGLDVVRDKEAADGSHRIVFMGDGRTGFQLELTEIRGKETPYDLGDEEFHLAFVTDEFDKFHDRHEKMGCICFENPKMGIYFINDPDGYWVEIVPVR